MCACSERPSPSSRRRDKDGATAAVQHNAHLSEPQARGPLQLCCSTQRATPDPQWRPEASWPAQPHTAPEGTRLPTKGGYSASSSSQREKISTKYFKTKTARTHARTHVARTRTRPPVGVLVTHIVSTYVLSSPEGLASLRGCAGLTSRPDSPVSSGSEGDARVGPPETADSNQLDFLSILSPPPAPPQCAPPRPPPVPLPSPARPPPVPLGSHWFYGRHFQNYTDECERTTLILGRLLGVYGQGTHGARF